MKEYGDHSQWSGKLIPSFAAFTNTESLIKWLVVVQWIKLQWNPRKPFHRWGFIWIFLGSHDDGDSRDGGNGGQWYMRMTQVSGGPMWSTGKESKVLRSSLLRFWKRWRKLQENCYCLFISVLAYFKSSLLEPGITSAHGLDKKIGDKSYIDLGSWKEHFVVSISLQMIESFISNLHLDKSTWVKKISTIRTISLASSSVRKTDLHILTADTWLSSFWRDRFYVPVLNLKNWVLFCPLASVGQVLQNVKFSKPQIHDTIMAGTLFIHIQE